MSSGRRAVRTVVREPAVAGLFYPSDPRALAAQVDEMLNAVEVPADDVLARAYVVPHAGYRGCDEVRSATPAVRPTW